MKQMCKSRRAEAGAKSERAKRELESKLFRFLAFYFLYGFFFLCDFFFFSST
jgi:hypothetical protein